MNKWDKLLTDEQKQKAQEFMAKQGGPGGDKKKPKEGGDAPAAGDKKPNPDKKPDADK